jgi:3-deoxy-manno-octulosonate cytidylyltransferase (CMP-KDO synthetase)
MDLKHKSQPKVVAIIPARYHSNRFEGKPLATIAGKPMIQHVYERAKSVGLLDDPACLREGEIRGPAGPGGGGHR